MELRNVSGVNGFGPGEGQPLSGLLSVRCIASHCVCRFVEFVCCSTAIDTRLLSVVVNCCLKEEE